MLRDNCDERHISNVMLRTYVGDEKPEANSELDTCHGTVSKWRRFIEGRPAMPSWIIPFSLDKTIRPSDLYWGPFCPDSCFVGSDSFIKDCIPGRE